MVGDDACSVFASLIQKLLEFIANMERNRQYNKTPKQLKQPKIKLGKISKKHFNKLQKAGTAFEFLPVPKELMPQFEESMKKMGGTFFTGGIEDNNNIYVAIPASQRNMAAIATQHMLSKKIEKQPDSFIVKDGNSKLTDEEMRITSDVMNSHDISMFAFQTDDGKYMTIVPKEFEGQYNKALAEVNKQLNEIKNIDVVRFEQTEPLDEISFTAEVVTDDKAHELADIAKYNELDIRFAKNGEDTAVLYNNDIAESIENALSEYEQSLSDSEKFTIDVTDNTISMDINKLVIPELSDDKTYFVRVPNTSGKDYLRLDKSDMETINSGKSLKTTLDMSGSYSIYDSSGNIKQERSGAELAKSYNTRHPHAKKHTKIYEHGQGMERVNLFHAEKNEIISMNLDSAENMKSILKGHNITGRTADMLLEDINKKLTEPQKEIFNFSKEKTEIVYADIPNIGEYLAQSQLSQTIVGKANLTGELPKDPGAKCCVMDNNTNSFAVIPVMPVKEVQAALSQMGYSEMSAKEIADKIVRSCKEGDVSEIKEEKENQKLTITPFDTQNAELSDCGYCKSGDCMILVRESEESYKYMSVDKGSSLADVEKALHDNFDIVDDLSAAVVMKQLVSDEIVKTCEPKIFDKDVSVSQVTSKYIEVGCNNQTAMMPFDKLDTEKLSAMGISNKAIDDIRKSFDKTENELNHTEKQPLSKLKDNAKNLLEKAKGSGGKVLENLKSKGQGR